MRGMFSSHEQLVKRSGKKGVDRPQYLKELVEEFLTSEHLESRRQVLANLSNFAYDPINYQWFRRLKIIDLFLDQASEGASDLCSLAVAGLCNLALDVENKQYILKNGGVAVLCECLLTGDEAVVISAITTLMFLVTPESKAGTSLPGPGTLVVRQELYFPNPCYAGEEVEVTVKLASLRKIITVDFSCTATEGKVVLEGSARLMHSKTLKEGQ
ncbi:Armadillo repeat-containing protein 7 [Chionoecetes opilio]|uniref:Armadillo repeat-containing protein 7 n=1 Tax=Chionoecetes opilio TaxID=41210 RepID=A0A8J5CS79_CHIOP|nr:Armadillo repeat-containing protein 7 [Chionoecetes opilio]